MNSTKDIMHTEWHFSTPIYSIGKSEWLPKIKKATDKFIKKAYKHDKPLLEKRKKPFDKNESEKIKDFGWSYHTESLIDVKELKELKDYVVSTSYNLLDEWGYNMRDYSVFMTEMWAQEFSKNGGGHHETHIHWNNHISGFYFLECSEKTSYPVFHDPRPGAMMTKLPMKNVDDVLNFSDEIKYNIEPGTLIFFPAYLGHQFVVDPGINNFKFIHFNAQAINNQIINQLVFEKKENE